MDGDDVAFKQQPKILSVSGFGGLGKTTLVKAVYDVLRPKFDSGAFVSVGRNPNMKNVLKEIFFEIDRKEYVDIQASTLDESQLIKQISRMLQNKRYFIVIDDIWDIRSWEIITCALMNNSCGSIIISTTRISGVASTVGDVYKLKPLCFDKSKELFYKRVSISKCKNTCDQSIELSKKILHKCGGIPLAIITVASLLADKQMEDWSEVYNSIGFGDGDNIHVNNTRRILLYSYYDLPFHLRTCLLYLSIYPEDYIIIKYRLIWKWVAEGFVHDQHGMGSYEMGERYFNELINRNMIQPTEVHYKGIVIGCRVHDLVLDMIYALSKEDNFVTVLGSNEAHIPPQINARRLAFQEIVIEHEDPLFSTPMFQARSFNTIRCRISTMPSLSSFQVLRVLAIESCTFMDDSSCHLEHIGRLLQLRYLGVRDTPITELPRDIGSLRFLQTLELRETKIRELPLAVSLLCNLKCLRLDCHFKGLKDWIANLTSLEELLLENVSSLTFGEELANLTLLRDLRINFRWFSRKYFNCHMLSLSSLQKIQRIKFSYGQSSYLPGTINWGCEPYVLPRHLRDLSLPIGFHRLPECINSAHIPHLSHLHVRVKIVHAQDLEILGRFQDLISLTLFTDDSALPDVVGGGAFPKLRYFRTTGKAKFLPGAMPCLEYLDYSVMERLDRDFDSIKNLPCLEKIQVTMDRAPATDNEEVEAALTHAVKVHPNNPILKFDKETETD